MVPSWAIKALSREAPTSRAGSTTLNARASVQITRDFSLMFMSFGTTYRPHIGCSVLRNYDISAYFYTLGRGAEYRFNDYIALGVYL